MDKSMLQYYKAIGAVQNIIANSETLDEALQGGLKAIIANAGADGGAIWYADKTGEVLRPFFWIGPVDLTSRSHVPGVGSVGSSSGSVPFAVAVFFTLPARMSCSVTSCVNFAVAISCGFSSVLSSFAVMSSGS